MIVVSKKQMVRGLAGMLAAVIMSSQAQAAEDYKRPCMKQDLLGVWKLFNVSEEPKGSQLITFERMPHQYISFEENTMYNEEIGMAKYVDSGKLVEKFRRNSSQSLTQYVITDTGSIYIYRNSVATDLLNCTFVTANHDFYKKGDLLLGFIDKSYQFWRLYRKAEFESNTPPRNPKKGKTRKGRRKPAPNPAPAAASPPPAFNQSIMQQQR